jgi:glycosyltransferase involved in cell wall biosynthesis
MYGGHTVAVVVPAYNEEAFVGEVLESTPSFVDRIYAVDDASTDGTWRVVRRHADRTGAESRTPTAASTPAPAADADTDAEAGAARRTRAEPGVAAPDGGTVDGRVVAIRHAENQGAGGALRTGYRQALEDGMDVTVAMDADGQMDPDRMTDLLDPIVEGRADYAKGNRLADPAFRDGMPRFRRFGNVLLTLLTRIASGYWGMMDPQNGYTAISEEALAAVDPSSLPSGHDYTNELLVRLNVAGMRVADVGMPAVYGDESSTITYSRFVPRTSATLLRAFLRRLASRARTPAGRALAMLYGASTASGLAGLLCGLGAARDRVTGAGPDGGDDGARAGGDGDGVEGDGAADAGVATRGAVALVAAVAGALSLLGAVALDRGDDAEVRRE